jgi:hypothetical protein
MKKIGVLFGQENTFPGALVEKINSMHLPDIHAEFVQVGGVRHAVPSGYEVIVDRISHDIPFYRAYLKNAVLCGTKVINNPFWWSADDKFFNYALAEKLGVAVPKTVILPHKKFPEGTNEKSMRNLEYPLDWDGIFEYVPPSSSRSTEAAGATCTTSTIARSSSAPMTRAATCA